jgi:hypothetical protein
MIVASPGQGGTRPLICTLHAKHEARTADQRKFDAQLVSFECLTSFKPPKLASQTTAISAISCPHRLATHCINIRCSPVLQTPASQIEIAPNAS